MPRPTDEPARAYEIPTRPASPPADWPTFHLAHPGPGRALPGDPNCALFWKGRYHLHYIYDRYAQAGDDAIERFYSGDAEYAFAHLVSTDLVHWTWAPTTLTPDVLGHGTFSGTALVTKEGRPAIVYCGVVSDGSAQPIFNRTAIAEDDDLERWTASTPMTVRVGPDQDGSAITHSDPDAWLEGDTYYGLFGGPPTSFRSTDLVTWDYLGLFLDPDLPDAAEDTDVSCANFFPLGDKHMLLCISHNLGCRYYLGRWENERFTPEFHGRMNWHERDVFAPESLLTPDGRRVMWAWAWVEAPQSGIQTLPRELELPADGILRIRPLRELETLRADERREDAIELPAGGEHPLAGVAGDALEIAVTFHPGSGRRFGVRVHADARGDGGLPITVDRDARTLSIGDVEAPLELADDEEVRLRIFVDKYLVEAFANDRQAVLLAHIADPADVGVALFSDAGDIAAEVTSWRVESIYPG